MALPLATSWMDLAGIMSEMSRQNKTNTVCYHLFVESEKYKKQINANKKEADSQVIENKLVVSSQEREGQRGNLEVGVKEDCYRIR